MKGFLRSNVGGLDVSGSQAEKADDYSQSMRWFEGTGIRQILPDEKPVFGGRRHVCHDEPVIARASEEDMAWAPVVSLVMTLPHLTTLVYDCRNQFPPSLLDTLHEHHPECKLHHLTFRLRSHLWDIPDPYGMDLSTSPCLCAVKVACGERDSVGDDDFNQEAVMELVAGHAPNLKEVVVVNLRPAYSWNFPKLRAPWKGLPGSVPGSGVGSLTSLSLVGEIHWSPDLLQAWAKYADFLNLRHLVIGGGYGCGVAHAMNDEEVEWIVQNCPFPRLRTLRIRLARDDLFVEKRHYADNAVALFRSLEPLEELSVCGPLEPKILGAILSRHGSTLKRLDLRLNECPFDASNGRDRRDMPMLFGKEHVLQIQAACPALEQLAIPVKRTKSDAGEAEIYKTFGRIQKLQDLFIILDCSEWRVTRDSTYDPPFDGPDDESCKTLKWLKKGHLRDTFMNCGVDETLARSIWNTICQHKVGRQLRSLKLWTTGGGKFGNSTSNNDHRNVVDNLSRSWLLELVVGDEVDVRELGRRARGIRDQKLASLYKLGKPCEESEVVRIFRRVWPRKEGSEDWREDWSSLTLQV